MPRRDLRKAPHRRLRPGAGSAPVDVQTCRRPCASCTAGLQRHADEPTRRAQVPGHWPTGAGRAMTVAVDASFAAAGSLWRLCLLGHHIVRGVLIVRLGFGRLRPAQRHAHIAAWSQGVLRLLGVGLTVQGELAAGPKLIVANHVSWLDIVVIHAVCPQARFVSKAVVRDWPLIGPLVVGAGTLLVDRQRRRDTARALQSMVQALEQGDTVALFPGGHHQRWRPGSRLSLQPAAKRGRGPRRRAAYCTALRRRPAHAQPLGTLHRHDLFRAEPVAHLQRTRTERDGAHRGAGCASPCRPPHTGARAAARHRPRIR